MKKPNTKKTKMKIFISKIRFETKFRGDHYFWYQIGQGGKRIILKGTFKGMVAAREELIEKYKEHHIKLGS